MPYLKLDDTELYYEVHGEGPPFLFLPATDAPGAVWSFFQVPEFSRDHRVIICDQRGTGKSKTRSKDFTTTRMAADAAVLLDHLDASNAIVCGHSIGGRVAQLLALDHPGAVRKLILASTGARTSQKGIPIKMCVGMVEKGFHAYLREHCYAVGFGRAYVANHRDEIEKFLRVRLAEPAPLETYLRIVAARSEHDTSGRLKDIRQPTLVIAGDEENIGSASGMAHLASSEMLAREIPGARFVLLGGQGHYYPYSDPVAFNRAIRDFLAASG
jgi:pimeloyl-ACP methyl ester carboxylesterase